ncbi:AAA family ATPase [Falsihalocynthiibacter sp. BN13B15]|uniref:AAA family ATPase n=1 Tax=Falsihalocynthiibacter sp. BN13B15 TaxID=3240871 RepID=UPI00350FB15B
MRKREFRVTRAMFSKKTLTAASGYIEQGFRVLLLHGIDKNEKCTCGNLKCTSPGKHPISEYFPEGVHSATRSKYLIRKALKRHPLANLAVTLAGITVVDVDGPEGQKLFQTLKLPPTSSVQTSRGTHHYFLKEAPSGTFKRDQLDILTGISRMAVVPPSRHASGHTYRWASPVGTKAIEARAQIESLRPSDGKTKKKKRQGKAEKPSTIPEGKRNDTLFRHSTALRRILDDDAFVFDAISSLNQIACDEPLEESEIKAIARSSGRYSEPVEELFGPPKQRFALQMEWLWYPYLPKYGLTILAGDPGRGKSMLIALLISIVTTGGKWPLSDERSAPGKVLLLSAEDSFARVTLARLEKTGFNIDNLDIMHSPLALIEDRLQALEDYVYDKKPAMVVIDTFSHFMGGARDMHRQNEVGEFLGRLNDAAEATGTCILGLGHLNKQTNEHPLNRIVGSIGFAATVRSALFLGVDPADPERLALGHGKASASPEGPTIVFEKYGGGRDDVPKLVATGEIDADVFEICAPKKREPGRPATQSAEAREHILKTLSDKPMSWLDVWLSAQYRTSASEPTVNAVRAELAKEGLIVQVGKGPNSKWKLTHVENDDSS